MKDVKFKAYVYVLTDEDSHPLEIDLRRDSPFAIYRF
jgi:hypothetical protein